MMYTYRLEYDGCIEDDAGTFVYDPPHIYIVDHEGFDVMEVFIDPKPLVDMPSDSDADWEVPAFVVTLVTILNANAHYLA